MGGVSVLGSTQQIRDALGRVADIGRDPSRVLSALGAGVVRHTQWRIEAGVDPHGKRWDSYAPLNPIYATTKVGSGILMGRGGMGSGLAGSITSAVEGNTLVWGSKKIYSRIHQLGGIIQPKNKRWLSFEMGGALWHVDSVEIPARPYLGFTDQDRTFLVEELEDYLSRAVRG
ncbi:phage virion morphogenesis protein [Acetobacter cerevisiae]|uniref:phage virion morphogenesis protein n=1 Tax=Acetobacter cerevisiae TaxID=178900 RepID=UPI00209FB09D|nr:phage virion morphogenesis protein [Acetobacter cerevisiae]MCP1270908.1 phage virion morphogenesis protein [Acetobacter cerevisiae]MCP1278861.1 phage virion morphogenesis protein [Acetobacter cerevisiae]